VNLRRWLTPGIGVKRWLLLAFVGLLILALGFAHALRQATRDLEPGGVSGQILDALTLQFLPLELRGLVGVAAGAAIFVFGVYRLMRALVAPFRDDASDQPLVEVIYQKRFLARGPRIVALGGGTGLSTLLRGLKEHTSNLTAVVTVADDGGSSGRLREELGIPAVGDIRNCIVALADAEPLMSRLLQYRFPGTGPTPLRGATTATTELSVVSGPTDGSLVTLTTEQTEPAAPTQQTEPTQATEPTGLAGHAIGNLLLAALCALENDDFEEAVREMNRVLAVRGRVVPATSTPVVLHARLADGTVVEGQSRITRAAGVDEVWVTPGDVAATRDAIRAIEEADVVVLGPGSLFTSVLPAVLVPGIRDALSTTGALRVYVCNVATQDGETTGFDLASHVEAFERHAGSRLLDAVLANNRFDARAPGGWLGEPVRLRWPPAGQRPPRLILDDMIDPANAHRHDSDRLATALMRIWDREGGSRRRAPVARSA